MDTFLAVASKREVRAYSERPLPDDAVHRILEAGRIAGSSQNRQRRTFVVVSKPELREQLADAVYAPRNVRAGNVEWHDATTPAEAIRRAILLPARKPPGWLREAAASAEAQLLADNPPEAVSATEEDGSGERA